MNQVEIRVEGHLDQQWKDWLGELCIRHIEGNETILSGSLPDQAALYGLISKLRDMGVKLITIQFGDRDSE